MNCMSKEEAIEVTATVLETLPNAMFKVAIDGNEHDAGPHLWQNAEELHTYSARRQGSGRAFALRSETWKDHVSLQVEARRL